MGGEKARSGKYSVPNMLSVFRIALIPVFVAVFFVNFPQHRIYAALLLVLSGITDFLDGYVARHFDMITETGKLLDPLADKLTQATVCVCLAVRYPYLSFLLVVFIIREILMVIGGARLFRRSIKVDGARWYGKVATFAFYVVTVSIIAFDMSRPLQAGLLLGVLALMIFAFVMYVRIYLRLIKQAK